MATGYTTSVTNSLKRITPLHSLHQKSRSYSTVPSIQANHQIFSTGAKHLKCSDRPRSPLDERLTSAAVRFTSFPGLLRSRFLVYHACLVLDKCPCFTLAQSFRGYREKRWTDTRTHPVPTYRQTTVTLAAHARRRGLITTAATAESGHLL